MKEMKEPMTTPPPVTPDPETPITPVTRPPWIRPSDHEIYGHDHDRYPMSACPTPTTAPSTPSFSTPSFSTPPSTPPSSPDESPAGLRRDPGEVVLSTLLNLIPAHPAWTITALLTAGYCHLTGWSVMAAMVVWPYYAGSALAAEIHRDHPDDRPDVTARGVGSATQPTLRPDVRTAQDADIDADADDDRELRRATP